MLIPFPDDDEPRRGIADFLREAQRLLGGNEIDSAMLQVRKVNRSEPDRVLRVGSAA
jgi:hypothetical protein